MEITIEKAKFNQISLKEVGEALKKGLEKGDFKYVQLYYNYVAGKPKETKDIHINEDVPLFID